jgi:hypothetical protein
MRGRRQQCCASHRRRNWQQLVIDQLVVQFQQWKFLLLQLDNQCCWQRDTYMDTADAEF